MVDTIRLIMQKLGDYSVPIMFFLVELLFALVIANGFWRVKRLGRTRKRIANGQQLYEQAVSEGNRQFQALVRCKDKKTVFMTDNAEELLGVDKEKLWYQFSLLEKTFGKKNYYSLLREYREWKGEEPFVKEFMMADSDRFVQLEVKRIWEGTYDYFTVMDITDYKRREFLLEQKIEQVKEESQSKTTFLYRMSHEIRTPMNGIIGMVTLAQKNMKPDKEVLNYLDKASELSQYLLSLINDILDMSRIEAGKIELAQDVIDLNHMMAQLDDMFRKTIEEKGVSFVVESEDMDIRYVTGDELRIMQVIVNFLSNSVKFTKKGEIRVTFREMYRTKDSVDLMVRVSDTGKGMEPEFVDRIFKPFEQENSDVQKNYGGTGLGMAITDQIVKLMGGHIVIDSLPGKGSHISVYMKLGIPEDSQISWNIVEEKKEEQQQAFASEDVLQGLRILLVEDNEINAEIALSILTMDGAVVDHAQNGKVAVEKFAASPVNEYDVILMDIHMPVMNGLEAVQEIRKLPREDAESVIVIALSADAFVEDKRRAIEAGMNDHLAKPIDFAALKETIARFVSQRENA